ncbi:MAG: hypothetical protein Q7U28_02695 [Aquabacterium sp.]|nr:hypothetical protein [Aquabacterium sp.]
MSLETSTLLQGLATLNPAIQDHFKIQDTVQRNEGAEQAALTVQRIADPRTALSGSLEAPGDASPAFSYGYREELKKGLAFRAASEIKTETLSAYAQDSQKPDFNAESWLAEHRAKAMSGVQDPMAEATIGAHFGVLEEQIRMEDSRKNMQRLQEVNNTTAASYAAESFSGAMRPQELGAAYPLYLEKIKGLGFTPKEGNQIMLNQIQHESQKAGGVPELFDVFDQPGADGKPIRFYHPELSAHIDQARKVATQERDKAIVQGAEKGNALSLMEYERDILFNPEKVTPERVLADMGAASPFKSDNEAAAMVTKAWNAQLKKKEEGQAAGFAASGELWRVDPKVQDKALTTILAPHIEALAQATKSGDTHAAELLGARIMQDQSRTGSTIPSDQLARYVKTLVSNLPSAEGASPAFMTGAALYKSMSANPAFRDMYFDEKSAKLLESFNSGTANGSDPKAAYTQAYQSVSPEAQAAAESFVKTPEFQALLKGDSMKWAEGSSMWPQWLGGNGRPQNTSTLSMSVSAEMKSWRGRNPFATDQQAMDYAESWTKKNFVLDPEGRSAVKIPPGFSGPAAQEALAGYSKSLAAAYKLNERSDGNWSVQYAPDGDQGYYTVHAFNGAQVEHLGRVSLEQLINNQYARTHLSPEELATVGRARQSFASGNLIDIPDDLLVKAMSTKALSQDQVNAYRAATLKKVTQRINDIPVMTFGNPSTDRLQFDRQGSVVDNQQTARSALDFMRNPTFDQNTKHAALAASLITMGEGVSSRRYMDPAKGAGANIGMGYNLNANKDNAVGDLRTAGVPPERIQDVIDGKASLTPKQSERLLLTAMPRYEKQVKQTAEATSPGLWARMTPAQKAVMIDVAWQVGDAGKFKEAWKHLASGDQKGFAAETKVTYVNQAGAHVEDTRRNNLRASLLAGYSNWESTVQTFGKLPSSKLQASLLTANTSKPTR